MFPLQLNRHAAGCSAKGASTLQIFFSFLLDSVESFDVSCSKWYLGALFQKRHPAFGESATNCCKTIAGIKPKIRLQKSQLFQVVAEVHQHLVIKLSASTEKRKQQKKVVKSVQLTLILSHTYSYYNKGRMLSNSEIMMKV